MDSLTAVVNRLSLGQASDNAASLARLAALIRAENARAGLVSRGDVEAIEQRHFAESLALLEALETRGLLEGPVADIGSGAGLPGLPIAVLRPKLEMMLLESNQKKAAFLERAAQELDLEMVSVVWARAEEAARDPAHRDAYRLVLARAVAPLPVLLELTLPFAATGGVLAAPKGSAARREIAASENALAELGGSIEEIVEMPVMARGPMPTLILVRKTGPTPERYPRRPGIPRKRPL
jgi:16S rRNA (guanine527-N7)-methyltransferase